MSDVVIRVESLGKRYRIGEREPYLTLRDTIARAVSSPFRKLSSPSPSRNVNNHFWALRDVSFEVRRGEVVGIVGRNGAGKSTLLKILSRVTRPTCGYAQISGRLGSLLEVGTGFHPELTGRENIYMNGAILGMSRIEIARRFDEIVAFSEIEKFIDTPVKYYSSGMYVRLAFSVAAHLEPDILIVDEVLAVGDVAFQKKCLDRMSNTARLGRTVLFVSHNMSAVSLLCKSAMVLEEGRIKMIADSRKAIGEYLTGVMDHGTKVYNVENASRPDPSLNRKVEFLSVELDGFPAKLVPADADLAMLMTVRGNQTVDDFSFNLSIFSANGEPVGTCSGSQVHSIRSGETARYRLQLPNPRLAPGSYWIDLGMATGNERTGFREFDAITETLHFEVMPPPGENGTVSEWQPSWGAVRLPEPATTRCD